MNKLVSVAVPCRNEMAHIEGCIEAILKSNYTPLEIIIVDGMSDDGTRNILEMLSKKHKNVRYVDNPEKLTPYAFNYGVTSSNGEFVQIVGSRNILDPDYISTLVKTLEENPEIGCTGGNYQHSYESDISRYISYAMESKFGMGGDNYRTKKSSCFVDTVGVPMYRKSIFDKLGLFDKRLTRNQDDDFNYRVTKAGYKIYYQAEAKTLYYVRGSFKKAFKQFSQYGYFKVFVNKKHKTVTTLRQLVPAIFLIFLLLGALLCILAPPFLITYLSILALYWILGVISALTFTKNPKEIFMIQLATFTIHIGYGWGYLKGILDFLILSKKAPDSDMQRQTN